MVCSYSNAFDIAFDIAVDICIIAPSNLTPTSFLPCPQYWSSHLVIIPLIQFLKCYLWVIINKVADPDTVRKYTSPVAMAR